MIQTKMQIIYRGLLRVLFRPYLQGFHGISIKLREFLAFKSPEPSIHTGHGVYIEPTGQHAGERGAPTCMGVSHGHGQAD